jgi:hypothetical protein
VRNQRRKNSKEGMNELWKEGRGEGRNEVREGGRRCHMALSRLPPLSIIVTLKFSRTATTSVCCCYSKIRARTADWPIPPPLPPPFYPRRITCFFAAHCSPQQKNSFPHTPEFVVLLAGYIRSHICPHCPLPPSPRPPKHLFNIRCALNTPLFPTHR